MDATNAEKSEFGMDFMKSMRDSLLSCMKDDLNSFHIDHVSIIKRNKQLSKGDFVIIASEQGAKPETGENGLNAALTQAFKNSEEYSTVPQDSPSECYIKLERSCYYRKALKQVIASNETYGTNTTGERQCVTLNYVPPGSDGLEQLRCVFLTEHIGNLLQANGYTTKSLVPRVDKSLLDSFNIQLSNPLGAKSQLEEACIKEQLTQCPYRITEGSGDAQPEELVLDMKRFMQEHQVVTGKEGYDKNLQSVKLTEPLLLRLCDVTTACQDSDVCVHVTSAAQEYTQQQVDLMWQALHTDTSCRQTHQVVGGITARKSGTSTSLPSVKEFLRLRNEQMLEVSKLKYGDQVTGSGWMDTIMALTVAGIKFEFLSTSCRSQLKLDLSSKGPVDSRGGVFVMYNYARLATLHDKFKQDVEEGVYPDIPSEEELDFSVLKDEEEWSLLFNYILAYPSLVRECVADVSRGKLRGPVLSHKVCHFLSDLSRDLSSYYRRVRILTDPRPHLYPAMHCRLYLMRAVQVVMGNALKLLGILPISQL